jgi:uncharacterized protein (DUF2267 family)
MPRTRDTRPQEPAVDYEQFITIVEQQADLGREAAERATRAVLQTLAERIAQGEARDLADELPLELAPWLFTDGDAEAFHADEFLRRVADREDVDIATAQRHVRAVFTALARSVSDHEFADMVAELPRDFDPLLPEGPAVEVLSIEEFLQEVADRAGLEPEAARRAADAVLETLAERIAGGEVADLINELPRELQPALERGNALSHGAARKMSLDEFVDRVAEREGVTPDAARDPARAVFATLREALSDKEFSDTVVQLPDDYSALLARP